MCGGVRVDRALLVDMLLVAVFPGVRTVVVSGRAFSRNSK